MACGGSVSVPEADPGSMRGVPSASPGAKPSAVATTSAGGGTVTIVVPTPAPVVCSPATVTIRVGQRQIVSCTAQLYVGPIDVTVADPSVAEAEVATGTFTFFYIYGLEAGTTLLTFTYPPTGAGTLAVTVSP